MRRLNWSRLLAGHMRVETALEKSVPEGLQLMDRTHTGSVNEQMQTIRRTCAGKVHGALSPMGLIPWWTRKEFEESFQKGGRSGRDNI